ncbi:T9SS type A sorting domain-containing protein [Rufibacter sediminis]|uniref:T9SS type A sorting domain-containing protein n=1 Tax=Rufibacter sediminis TaxID=2762756 RepID=A0ABR6VZ32_9BACT|nr:T9SS type A sorting domain-containing protein [Rufibacter sediminis]MBC3542152.1 T9SS type A sorting domain-containing protein [Rufibacter sediminis]
MKNLYYLLQLGSFPGLSFVSNALHRLSALGKQGSPVRRTITRLVLLLIMVLLPLSEALSQTNFAPVASDFISSRFTASTSTRRIIDLQGSDAERSTLNFKILSLPKLGNGSTGGSLYLTNTSSSAITVNQIVTNARLYFISGNTIGVRTFTYSVIDADGNESAPATFTIPIGNNNNQAQVTPTAFSMIITPLSNTSGPTDIADLTYTGSGTVNGYRLTSIPNPTTQGSLYIGTSTTPIVLANGFYHLTTTQATQLRFDPVPSYTGLVTFTYAPRNNNTIYAPGTFYIPLVVVETEAIYSVNKPSFNKDGLANNSVLATVSDGNGAIVTASSITEMPPGMSLNSTNGTISVSNIDALSAGEYTRYINTTDIHGGTTSSTVVIKVLNDNEAVYSAPNTFSSTSIANGATLATVTDIDGAISSASISGAPLPTWMTLNAATGVITRTGTSAITAGVYTRTVNTTDVTGGKSTVQVSIVVNSSSAAYSYISQHYSIHALRNGTEVAKASYTSAITSARIAPNAPVLPNFLTLNSNGSIMVNNNPVSMGTYATTIQFNGNTSLTASVVIDINDDAYQINNEAFRLGDNNYRLTTAETNKRGEVWKTTPIDLSRSFEITFKANFGTLDADGADGIAFAFQRHGTNPLFAYGQTGEGLGVGNGAERTGGISPSLVVEFDTWQNTTVSSTVEPTYDHLAIFLNGEERSPVSNVVPMKGTVAAPLNVEDGTDHLVKLIWNKTTNLLSVYFDDNLRTSYTSDLVKNVFGNDPLVYFGFSASTGNNFNQQRISEINFTLLDIDGDGIANNTDFDSDNDGVSNEMESNSMNPFADHNSDGLSNYKDPIFAASIGSFLNAKGVVAALDTDSDGVINALDLDSDNDGIPDTVEANNGNLPSNMSDKGQYLVSYVKTADANQDGMVDAVQTQPLQNGDKDGDGLPNALDLDSDGDGIVDAIEANGGTLPNGMNQTGQFPLAYMFQRDQDGDGISDIVASSPLANDDFDQDGLANFLDLDADNDGLPDNLEAQHQNNLVVFKRADANRNGIDDAYDAALTGGLALIPINSGGLSNPDFLDLDSDGDGFGDTEEAMDKNDNGKSEDDLKRMASSFAAKSGNPNAYPATPGPSGRPTWMDKAFDNRLNLLSPKSTLHYKDTNADGMVDMFDAKTSGEESTTSEINYAFRSFAIITPLPVNLVTFKAKAHGHAVTVSWETASEKDNDYFQVERSENGKNFNAVARVKGNGTSNILNTYSYLDTEASAGTIYYRLKQVDFDGQHEYSKVIALQTEDRGQNAYLEPYPNPTEGKVTFKVQGLGTGYATIKVFQSDGKEVMKQHLQLEPGHAPALDLSGLPTGVYYIQLQTPKCKVSARVLRK